MVSARGSEEKVLEASVGLMVQWATDMGLIEWHMGEDGEFYFTSRCACAPEVMTVPLGLLGAISESGRLIWGALGNLLS